MSDSLERNRYLANREIEDDANTVKDVKRRIFIFLCVVAVLSLPGYWLLSHPNVLGRRMSYAVLMWAPGLSGLLTLAVTGGSFRSIGWHFCRMRYFAAALSIPFVCDLPSYLLVWLVGLAAFDPSRWAAALPYGLVAHHPASAAFMLLTIGLLDSRLDVGHCLGRLAHPFDRLGDLPCYRCADCPTGILLLRVGSGLGNYLYVDKASK